MTRFIEGNQLIGGLPAPQVRTALRALTGQTFDEELLAMHLRPERSVAQARALLSALVADGFVEWHGEAWALTRTGVSLANASGRKPIPRVKAEALLGALLGRVTEARDDGKWAYRPAPVYLFGSLLTTDKPLVGDVDVVVELAPRHADQAAEQAAVHAYVKREKAAGRTFDFIDELAAPTRDLYRFLRGRASGINFASERTLEDLTGERFELLYEYPSFTPAGEAWLARIGGGADTRKEAATTPVKAARRFDVLLPRRRGRPWVTFPDAEALRDALLDCVRQVDASLQSGRLRFRRKSDARTWVAARDAVCDADAAILAEPAATHGAAKACADHIEALLRAAMLVGLSLASYEKALLDARRGRNNPIAAYWRLFPILGELYFRGLVERNQEILHDPWR